MKRRYSAVLVMLAVTACKSRDSRPDELGSGDVGATNEVAPADPKVRQCESGSGDMSAVVCNELGDALAKGNVDGGAADPATGATYYQRACDKGFRLGCRNLAGLHIEGRGVAVNRVKAIELYERACAARLGLACDELGSVYDKGLAGGSIDNAKAVNAYQRGCDVGSGSACRELGRHYLHGSGVPRDATRAITLYERGCENDRLTCDYLGDVHAEGQGGMPVDQKKAAIFYDKGCKAGLQLSCEHLAALGRTK